MTITIFLKIAVTALAVANFKQLNWMVLYKRINVQGRLGLNLEKNPSEHSDFMQF